MNGNVLAEYFSTQSQNASPFSVPGSGTADSFAERATGGSTFSDLLRVLAAFDADIFPENTAATRPGLPSLSTFLAASTLRGETLTRFAASAIVTGSNCKFASRVLLRPSPPCSGFAILAASVAHFGPELSFIMLHPCFQRTTCFNERCHVG